MTVERPALPAAAPSTALVRVPVEAWTVAIDADAGELAQALAHDERVRELWWTSLDAWWAHANARDRARLTYRLMRALDRLDALAVQRLYDPRVRSGAGVPLAIATFALTMRARRRHAPTNTYRALIGDWRRWRRWCKRERLPSFNPSARQLRAFFGGFAPSHKVATVRRFGASLTAMHVAAGFPDPLRTPLAREVWRDAIKPSKRKGARRRAAPTSSDRRNLPVDQAKGLTHDLLERVIQSIASNTLIGLRDAALLATGYDMAARVDELAALDVEQFRFERNGSGRVLIEFSKTDQQGAGAEQYLRPTTVTLLKRWFDAAQLQKGAAFRALRGFASRISAGQVDKAGRLTGDDVTRILQARVRRARLAQSGDFSGHSLRIGSAQDMAERGISLLEIMQVGRWKSAAMPARYTRGQLAARGGMAKLANKQMRSRRPQP